VTACVPRLTRYTTRTLTDCRLTDARLTRGMLRSEVDRVYQAGETLTIHWIVDPAARISGEVELNAHMTVIAIPPTAPSHPLLGVRG
jgi:hypothetical protein